MNFTNYTVPASAVQKYLFVLLLIIPAFAWSQEKKTKPPSSSAPAAHASAPAHTSGQAQHSTTSGRPNNGNSTGHSAGNASGGANNGRTAGAPNNGRAAGAANNGRTGGTPNNGRTGGTPNNGHGGASTTGRTGPNSPNNRMGHASGSNAGGRAASNHVAPGRQVSLRGGGTAQIRPNGQIRSVNRNGMHIERGVRGERRIVSTRNGVRVVGEGRRGGYVQRAYVVRGGHSYYSRTYYYHGAYRTGVYRGYNYGGRPYYGYHPVYYYRPAYYGWAYNPWPAPVAYGWGWGAAPWYGYYGPYYQPYPVYPSAAFWLTDFMIAASLQAAYQAQGNASLGPNAADGTLVASLMPFPAADQGTAKLSPEVKNALSEEVKIALAAEQAEAAKGNANSSGGQPADSNEAPPALDPKFRTFVVSSDMSLVADGDECPLSQGDVIQRTSDTPDDDGNVSVKVVASTKSDCGIGKEGPVSVDDLQEMYNGFREHLKDGMGELAKNQGTGGLPKAPDTSTNDGDVPAPPPDKSAEKSLQDQQSAADQAESEVKQESGSGPGASQ